MLERYNFKLWVANQFFVCCLLSTQTVLAQEVIPDGTTATPDPGSCAMSCTITGGTTDPTGKNIFHSFERFSVPDGSVVTFDHDPTIINILTRVTGGNLSIIDGRIRTDITSDTNLFLINPNGIIFGPNGGLELGGSFVATTANAIEFGDQGSFSTADTSIDPALLTVNPSALLFSQATHQPIINQSNAFNLTTFSLGLSVKEGNSLLLVGGDVILEPSPNGFSGGIITAPSGRIELGGVNGAATVSLDIDGSNLSLSYPENTTLAKVILDNVFLDISNSFVSVDRSAGSLIINANSISLSNNSVINSTTSGSDNAGSIIARADESVNISGTLIDSGTSGSGNGGSLIISTDELSLENGATLSVGTDGSGDAGNISLTANHILLNNSNIATQAGNNPLIGNPGEIEIQARTLSLIDKATISTATFGEAIDREAAGVIRIDAQEFVSLSDGSLLTSATFGQRNASDIIITTPELTIKNLASITATTEAEGDAGTIIINNANQVTFSNGFITTETEALGTGGNITLNTNQLTADSGARITATATTTADPTTQGGSVTLNANQINLSGNTTGILAETQGPANAGLINLGSNTNGEALTVTFQEDAAISAATSSSGDGGTVLVGAEAVTLEGNGSLSTRSTGSGPAGDVSIQTGGQFRVQDGARVEVSGEGTGDSGMLEVIAQSTVLNDAQLLASTQAGEDGNIRLQIEDALVLRGESLISAEAFNDADGGNVDIATPFIIALFPDGPNGSDIQASAVDGDGGRISIQANTLFNIAENLATDGNMTNDLDASSGTGIDGEVVIETLEIDPTQGTATLPTDPANPEIARGCQASGGGNGEFINSGRRGIPPNPYEPLSGDGIQEDIYPAGQTFAQPSTSQRLAGASENTPETLIEAQGWSRNIQGDIVLLAEGSESLSFCQRTSTGAS